MNELMKQKRKNVRGEVVVFFAMLVFSLWLLFHMSIIPLVNQKSMEQIDWNGNLDEVFISDLNLEIVGTYNLINDNNEEESGYFAQLPNGMVVRLGFSDPDDETSEKLGQLLDAGKAYASGKLSKEEYESYKFEYIGIIYAEDEIVPEKTVKACEGFAELTSEQQSNFKDYWIKVKSFEGQKVEILIFGCFVLLALGLFINALVPSFYLWRDKQIKRYLKTQNNRMYGKEKITQFFNTAQIEDDFWINKEFVGAIHEGRIVFGESKNVVAVFVIPIEDQITGNAVVNISRLFTRNISPVNMGILFKDGRAEDFTLQKGPKSAQKVINFIEENYHWIITDWGAEYRNMSMEELLTVRYNDNISSDGSV